MRDSSTHRSHAGRPCNDAVAVYDFGRRPVKRSSTAVLHFINQQSYPVALVSFEVVTPRPDDYLMWQGELAAASAWTGEAAVPLSTSPVFRSYNQHDLPRQIESDEGIDIMIEFIPHVSGLYYGELCLTFGDGTTRSVILVGDGIPALDSSSNLDDSTADVRSNLSVDEFASHLDTIRRALEALSPPAPTLAPALNLHYARTLASVPRDQYYTHPVDEADAERCDLSIFAGLSPSWLHTSLPSGYQSLHTADNVTQPSSEETSEARLPVGETGTITTRERTVSETISRVIEEEGSGDSVLAKDVFTTFGAFPQSPTPAAAGMERHSSPLARQVSSIFMSPARGPYQDGSENDEDDEDKGLGVVVEDRSPSSYTSATVVTAAAASTVLSPMAQSFSPPPQVNRSLLHEIFAADESFTLLTSSDPHNSISSLRSPSSSSSSSSPGRPRDTTVFATTTTTTTASATTVTATTDPTAPPPVRSVHSLHVPGPDLIYRAPLPTSPPQVAAPLSTAVLEGPRTPDDDWFRRPPPTPLTTASRRSAISDSGLRDSDLESLTLAHNLSLGCQPQFLDRTMIHEIPGTPFNPYPKGNTTLFTDVKSGRKKGKASPGLTVKQTAYLDGIGDFLDRLRVAVDTDDHQALQELEKMAQFMAVPLPGLDDEAWPIEGQ